MRMDNSPVLQLQRKPKDPSQAGVREGDASQIWLKFH